MEFKGTDDINTNYTICNNHRANTMTVEEREQIRYLRDKTQDLPYQNKYTARIYNYFTGLLEDNEASNQNKHLKEESRTI